MDKRCAFDKTRPCNKDCSAYRENDTTRDGDYVWDEVLREYRLAYTRVQMGDMCLRLGYMIDNIRTIKENNKKVE